LRVVDEVVLPQERLLPQNVDAEQAVLGSLLIDPVAVTQVATFLRPLDFYLQQHVDLFEAVLDLYHDSQPSDVVTLSDYLNRRGQLAGVGGLAYLNQLANSVPTAINIEHYGHIVERLAVLRRLVDAGSKIAAVGYDEANSQEQAIEKSEAFLFNVSRRGLGRDFQPINRILDTYFQRLDYIHEHRGVVTGVTTGFVDLDKLTGGLQPSDLIILAARPSMGKSSLALNIAHSAASESKASVGFFSLEMSSEQLVQRLLSMEAKIDSQRLRTGYIADDEWGRLNEGMGVLSSLPIYFEDSANISIAEMRSKARRLHMERGLDLIIVDYLQLMQGRNQDNRVQEISEISRSLKALARDLELPVLALSQLSRAPDQRPNHRPMLSDLRESGSIEQDADVVMFIYRDKVYNPETEHPHVTDVIVAKHRNGPTDTVHLFFKENQTRFVDLAAYGTEDQAFDPQDM
jgi:replicative DNA helicase